jgi:putative MATE family efflux protein
MSKLQSKVLGTDKISKLLLQQAVPAGIGMLIMSIYGIVDTIFVGHYVGVLGIAAITVVMPISFLISSIGMAIGIGGASIISRSFGGDDRGKVSDTFGNMISLTVILGLIIVGLGLIFQEPILWTFGAKGDILAPAKVYFSITLIGVPALAWAMMANSAIRAEGQAKMAMVTMLIPAILNMILDPIFIIWFDWGLEGAAWATAIAYFSSGAFTAWFLFFSGRSELKIFVANLKLRITIIKEIFSIGIVTIARQGTISILMILLNYSLFTYGDESSIAVFGIINRMMMFALFPVLGIMQGFQPIAGYNYGAGNNERVQNVINLAIKSSTVIATAIFVCIIAFPTAITTVFTTDENLLKNTPVAMIIVFGATPLISVQLIGSAYFQAIGKAIPALLLTLTKQGFFLIPLILILPPFFGLNGVWWSFPIADVLSAIVTYWYLRREMKLNLVISNDS